MRSRDQRLLMVVRLLVAGLMKFVDLVVDAAAVAAAVAVMF